MHDDIAQWLREDGQLGPGPASLTPLSGGVSCDIFRVEQDGRAFIFKRALPKLRVAADWQADVSRNAVEHDFFSAMAGPLARSVPRVFFHNPARGYFTMECLDADWENWKTLLLHGDLRPAHAHAAGQLMGRLHASTWDREEFARRFDTTKNFRQLRTDPYLRATAENLPEIAHILRAEADRIEQTRLCLVHGDFSPKNILLHGSRMVLLDAEVAWYGDPAFDTAFLHTHFFLKGLLHHPGHPSSWAALSSTAWDAYRASLGPRADAALERRCVLLLAAILLARVEGKSPVEYLGDSRRAFVRDFASAALLRPHPSLASFRSSWNEHLIHLAIS